MRGSVGRRKNCLSAWYLSSNYLDKELNRKRLLSSVCAVPCEALVAELSKEWLATGSGAHSGV